MYERKKRRGKNKKEKECRDAREEKERRKKRGRRQTLFDIHDCSIHVTSLATSFSASRDTMP